MISNIKRIINIIFIIYGERKCPVFVKSAVKKQLLEIM
jgi:hypothetical protein